MHYLFCAENRFFMSNILVTGATGLVGKNLVPLLLNRGHNVRTLSRKSTADPTAFRWDIEQGFIEEGAFDNIDFIIHLAGANIAEKRWTAQRKKELFDSRILSTQLLLKYCQLKKCDLKGFICASAVGFYGFEQNESAFKEADPPGNDFLANLCAAWERSAMAFNSVAKQVTLFRIGIVLAESGGALTKMLPVFKYGFGAALGSGKQAMPWIHLDDLLTLFTNSVREENYTGIFNAVAPENVDNRGFSMTLAKTMNKRLWLPNVPAWLLQLMLGELAVVLIRGASISSAKLATMGFKFKYPTLEKALRAVVQP